MRQVLAWIDLEMTGLEVSRHVIVEIASIVTDDDLNVIAEGPDLVIHHPAPVLARMDDKVRRMHAKSGLLAAIGTSGVTLEGAGELTLAFLREHIEEGAAPLCGNSIGTDRRFLDAQLPAVDRYLHYRSVDVSTIKELTRRWYPDLFGQVPAKRETHRALDDIKESIEELRWYRAHVFAGGRR